MKQTYTRMVTMPVRVVVEFKEAEGFYYATAPTLGAEFFRPTSMIVRSTDKETAIHEALLAAGYGDQK
jgi:hypothetical protein